MYIFYKHIFEMATLHLILCGNVEIYINNILYIKYVESSSTYQFSIIIIIN